MRLGVLFMATALGLAGCGSAALNQSSEGTYQSSASYDRVFAASLRAVQSVGYTVTSASRADGLIVAQQGVILGGGSTAGLNATVARAGRGATLHVAFQAPPGAIALGGFADSQAQYIAAVKTRLPDLRVASE
jgi:hypothetical protein